MNRSSSGGRPRPAVLLGFAVVAAALVGSTAAADATATIADADATSDSAAGSAGEYAVRALSKEEQKIRRTLAEPLQVPLELADNTLAEALEFVGTSHGVRLFADHAALANAQIDLNELRVSLNLEDVPLGHALNLMLGPSGLAYVVEDSVLKITTRERLEDTFERVVYDVGPLERVGFTSEHLADVVRRTVRPQQWDDVRRATLTGFPGEKAETVTYGSLQAVPGGLVVWHAIPVQREIEQLLGQLHRLAERQRAEQQRAIEQQRAAEQQRAEQQRGTEGGPTVDPQRYPPDRTPRGEEPRR